MVDGPFRRLVKTCTCRFSELYTEFKNVLRTKRDTKRVIFNVFVPHTLHTPPLAPEGWLTSSSTFPQFIIRLRRAVALPRNFEKFLPNLSQPSLYSDYIEAKIRIYIYIARDDLLIFTHDKSMVIQLYKLDIRGRQTR